MGSCMGHSIQQEVILVMKYVEPCDCAFVLTVSSWHSGWGHIYTDASMMHGALESIGHLAGRAHSVRCKAARWLRSSAAVSLEFSSEADKYLYFPSFFSEIASKGDDWSPIQDLPCELECAHFLIWHVPLYPGAATTRMSSLCKNNGVGIESSAICEQQYNIYIYIVLLFMQLVAMHMGYQQH